MVEKLEEKYQQYKAWLKERHVFEDTWIRNWDVPGKKLHWFGKKDSLFYTTIYLTALALEKNENEYIALLEALNQTKHAKGMYPRHSGEFDTSKDHYYTLLVALVYGRLRFPNNSLIQATLDEIIQAVRENKYKLKNPDGTNSKHGGMTFFKPIFACIEKKLSFFYWLTLWGSPTLSYMLNCAHKSYYNNFMFASQFLIYHLYINGGRARKTLKSSVKRFTKINEKHPYFLMVRDVIYNEKKYQSEVENILQIFPDDHLPNDRDHITHSDMMWSRDPRDWGEEKTGPELREYSGIDYMNLYQFYLSHYMKGEI